MIQWLGEIWFCVCVCRGPWAVAAGDRLWIGDSAECVYGGSGRGKSEGCVSCLICPVYTLCIGSYANVNNG